MNIVKSRLGNTDLFNEFDKLLSNTLPTFNFTANTLPAVNIEETKDAFQIYMAAPGYKKDELNVQVDKNILTISSEKQIQKNTEDGKFTRKEYEYAKFSRSFTLPENVKADHVEAKFEDGELKIRIPKVEEVTIKKQVSIL